MTAESQKISIERSDFFKFLNVLKVVSDFDCTDCDIEKGKIRQKTNDGHSIIQIDMNSLLGDAMFSISLVKQKVQLLRCFEVDDNIEMSDENIYLTINPEKSYEFIDAFSFFSFSMPLKKFLDNNYISDDKFNQLIKISEDLLVLEYDFNSYMAKRMKSVCEGFSTDVILCTFSGDDAQFSVSTKNKENTSKILEKVELNKGNMKGHFRIIATPFFCDLGCDIRLSVYQTGKEGIMLGKYSMDYNGIPIMLYTQIMVSDRQ